jgi:hypothetical protein
MLGGAWADFSWSRFCSGDPKEIWAVVALLIYLAVLHARRAGWVKDRGLAALSVVCFSLMIIVWCGVHFVLDAGRHSSGFAGRGLACIFAGVTIQLLFVGAALARSLLGDLDPSRRPAQPFL